MPRKGEIMTLTGGQALPVAIEREDLPESWIGLAQQIVTASGDTGTDASYVALVGLFRVMSVAWSDVLSEPVRRQAMIDEPPELHWFRDRALEEGVLDEADYELVKVASMLASPGSLESIRGSL